jgi:hypothetical protein
LDFDWVFILDYIKVLVARINKCEQTEFIISVKFSFLSKQVLFTFAPSPVGGSVGVKVGLTQHYRDSPAWRENNHATISQS